MKQRPAGFLLCLATYLVVHLVSACGKKPEAAQLAAARDGFVYKQYSRVSKVGLKPGLAVALATAQKSEFSSTGKVEKLDYLLTPASLCLTRIYLSIGALKTNKLTVALAETDLTQADPVCDELTVFLAQNVRAVVFNHEGWPGLAIAEQQSAGNGMSPENRSANVERLFTFHCAMAFIHVSEKNLGAAQPHIEALSLQLGMPWLSKLTIAARELQEGHIQPAAITLKQLSIDPSVPPEVRKGLAEAVGQIEAKAGDVESPAFGPKLLAVALWQIIKEKGPPVAATAAAYFEKLAPL